MAQGKPLSSKKLDELKAECTDRDLRLADTLMKRAEKFAPSLRLRNAKEIKATIETARILRGLHGSSQKLDVNLEIDLTDRLSRALEAARK